MHEDQVQLGEGLSWGLGWGLQQTSSGSCFWHFGGWETGPFYNFVLGSRNHGAGLVLMTNGANGDLFEDIVTICFGEGFPVFPWNVFISTYFKEP